MEIQVYQAYQEKQVHKVLQDLLAIVGLMADVEMMDFMADKGTQVLLARQDLQGLLVPEYGLSHHAMSLACSGVDFFIIDVSQ